MEVKEEREQREDATAAVNKLREVITDVSLEAERADSLAVSATQELGGERQARLEAEETIVTLRSQIDAMQELMSGFREEMGLMKERSEKAFSGVQKRRADINNVSETPGSTTPSNFCFFFLISIYICCSRSPPSNLSCRLIRFS